MALLSEEDVAERLRDSAWERDGDEIAREWKFDDFAAAMAFVNRVAEAAEEANHHPDILLPRVEQGAPLADDTTARAA
jgi:4a-hydroxytetrahydrobiopterin dehydratase